MGININCKKIRYTTMKKILTLVIAFALLAGMASARATLTDSTYTRHYNSSDTVKMHHWLKHPIAGAFQLQAMYRKANLDQLNQVLTHDGLAALGNNAVWLNLSAMHVYKHNIFEDGIGFTPTTTSNANNMEALYNQFQIYLRYGYNVVKDKDIRLFPFAGINFSDALLRIHDNSSGTSNDFNEALMGGAHARSFNQGRFGFDLGAGFDYLIPVSPRDYDMVTVQRNIPIGIRVGYFIQASHSDWRIDDYNLSNGPNNQQNAVFVSINIGLGYVVTRK